MSETSVRNVLRRHRATAALTGGRGTRFGPGLGMAVAVSVGAESVRAGLVDANGALVEWTRMQPDPRQLERPPEALLGRIRTAVATVLTSALDSRELRSDRGTLRLVGLASAWPCPVTFAGHPSGSALQHREWTEADDGTTRAPTLQERLARALGCAFPKDRQSVINDANAQALAVAFDWARGRPAQPDHPHRSVAMVVRVGGGIGAAAVVLAPYRRGRSSFLDSYFVKGTHNAAGELGHLTVERSVIDERNRANPYPDRLVGIDYDGWRCSCGRPHHLAAFASGHALHRRLKASGYPLEQAAGTRTDALRSLRAGIPDPVSRHALEDVGRILGRSLAAPVLMLDPEFIKLTGSLASPELAKGILSQREAWGQEIERPVEVEPLGDAASEFLGVRGAALQMLRFRIHRRFEEGVFAIREASSDFGPADLEALAG